jgi:hypothetical protein
MPTELRTCPSCGDERPFEVPPCQDGHHADCPELACVDCGAAVLLGPPLPVRWAPPPVLPRPGSARMSHAA